MEKTSGTMLSIFRPFGVGGLILLVGMLLMTGCMKKKISSNYGRIGRNPSVVADGTQSQGGIESTDDASAGDPGLGGLSEEGLNDFSFEDNNALASNADQSAELTAEEAAFTGEDVYFLYNSAVLEAEAQVLVKEKAAWMSEHAAVSVIIEGHTDERGTNEFNLALGDRRAEAVKDYLMTQGISEDRIITISYGEERPADSGESEAAWAKNRRAHFVVQ